MSPKIRVSSEKALKSKVVLFSPAFPRPEVSNLKEIRYLRTHTHVHTNKTCVYVCKMSCIFKRVSLSYKINGLTIVLDLRKFIIGHVILKVYVDKWGKYLYREF